MKRIGRGLWVLGAAIVLSVMPANAKEAGFSTATDPGFVTLKDIRLTLPEDWGTISFFGRDRLRYEAWNYFASATDNDYEFLANQLRLGGKWVNDFFNVNYTHQYTQLSNLPTATSAGAGAGSLYFSNSRNRNSHGQFVKYLNVDLKQIYRWPFLKPVIGDWKFLRGFSSTLGRFAYSSGNEMKSADAKLALVKSQRIADRLIGTFEWSHYGRSFDGVKLLYENDLVHGVVGGFSPTQGGFEERANRSIQDIGVIAAEATIKKDKLVPGMEENFFYSQRKAMLNLFYDSLGRYGPKLLPHPFAENTIIWASPAGHHCCNWKICRKQGIIFLIG